jgi:hypothetical protein
MTSSPRLETSFDSRRDEQRIVRERREERLRRLGVLPARAALLVHRVDRHAIVDPVAGRWPPTPALKIVH